MNTATSDVPEDGATHRWLIMVYMQASDNSNLDSLAVQDLQELQEGVKGSKDAKVAGNANVVVLVQMKRRWPSEVPQRYLIERGQPVKTLPPATEEDTATSESLRKFLEEGLRIGVEKKAQRFCLILWGHNFGLGFGRDHNDPLTLVELGAALGQFNRQRGEKVDLLATNSCTMAYIEAAFQIKDFVKYLVASQVFMPPTGFPYRSILRRIESATEPRELGEIFVDEYVSSFANSPNGEKVAMSLLDLDGAEPFSHLLEDAARMIQTVIERGGRSVVQQTLGEMQDVFLVNPAGDVRPVLDLQGLALQLRGYCVDRLPDDDGAGKAMSRDPFTQSLVRLRISGENLSNAIANGTIPAGISAKMKGDPTKLVLKKCQNPDLGPLSGIGVFAPFVVDSAVQQQLEIESKLAQELYKSLSIFAESKSWPEVVYNILKRDEPDEIVDANGVVRPAERLLVNQMAAGVDATFNMLDRVLKTSKKPLLDILESRPADSPDGPSADLAPFGPPKLRLAGDLTLETPPEAQRPAKVSKKIVRTFERIEQAIELVETTVKRVMTNSTFGLGPPANSVSFGPKSAGVFGPKSAGVFGPKSAGVFGPKSAGVFGPKSAGVFGPDDLSSEVGAITAFLSSDTQVAVLSVMVMFRALADSLTKLEAAVSDVELAAAQCLLQRDFGATLSDEDYRLAIRQRFDRLFSVAVEASLQARRTAREVMAHPVYGLGSGSEGFGQAERDELAAIAGLGQSQLAFL